MTIKEIRQAMRKLNKDGGCVSEIILVEGYGQIQKIGSRSDGYAVGPLPEKDDSDILTDYSAWTFGMREEWILDDIKVKLNIE